MPPPIPLPSQGRGLPAICRIRVTATNRFATDEVGLRASDGGYRKHDDHADGADAQRSPQSSCVPWCRPPMYTASVDSGFRGQRKFRLSRHGGTLSIRYRRDPDVPLLLKRHLRRRFRAVSAVIAHGSIRGPNTGLPGRSAVRHNLVLWDRTNRSLRTTKQDFKY